MTGQRGPAIQGKIFEYFMTRPNWAVHLPELATAIGETDLERVRRGVLNMKRSKEELGFLATLQRGQVWKWNPRQGSGLPGSNDPTAEPPFRSAATNAAHTPESVTEPCDDPECDCHIPVAGTSADAAPFLPADSGDTPENWNAEPNPLLEGLLEEGQRLDTALLSGTGDGQPMPGYDAAHARMAERFAAQNAEAARVWAEKDAADPSRHIDPVEAAKALARALGMPPREPRIPSQRDWALAKTLKDKGDTRDLSVIMTELMSHTVQERDEAFAEHVMGTRRPSVDVFTQEKPAKAFDTPQTMFQRQGTTYDGDAILKDEDGNFWKATRL